MQSHNAILMVCVTNEGEWANWTRTPVTLAITTNAAVATSSASDAL